MDTQASRPNAPDDLAEIAGGVTNARETAAASAIGAGMPAALAAI